MPAASVTAADGGDAGIDVVEVREKMVQRSAGTEAPRGDVDAEEIPDLRRDDEAGRACGEARPPPCAR